MPPYVPPHLRAQQTASTTSSATTFVAVQTQQTTSPQPSAIEFTVADNIDVIVDNARDVQSWCGGLLVYAPLQADLVYNLDAIRNFRTDYAARGKRCISMCVVSQRNERGRLQIPGGRRSYDKQDRYIETPTECAQRELREELGCPLSTFTTADYVCTKTVSQQGKRPQLYHYYMYVTNDKELYDKVCSLQPGQLHAGEAYGKASIEVSHSRQKEDYTFVGLLKRSSGLCNHDQPLDYATYLVLLHHLGVPMATLQAMYQQSGNGDIPTEIQRWFDVVGPHRYAIGRPAVVEAAARQDVEQLASVARRLAVERNYVRYDGHQLEQLEYTLVVLWVIFKPRLAPQTCEALFPLCEDATGEPRPFVVCDRRKASDTGIEAIAQRKLWKEYQIHKSQIEIATSQHYAFTRETDTRNGIERQHFLIICVRDEQMYRQMCRKDKYRPRTVEKYYLTGRRSMWLRTEAPAFLQAITSNMSLYKETANHFSHDFLLVLMHLRILDQQHITDMLHTRRDIFHSTTELLRWSKLVGRADAEKYVTHVSEGSEEGIRRQRRLEDVEVLFKKRSAEMSTAQLEALDRHLTT